MMCACCKVNRNYDFCKMVCKNRPRLLNAINWAL
jgi:hypothetical protein